MPAADKKVQAKNINKMATTKWQCSKCGQQRTQTNAPSVTRCKQGGNCIWSRLGRFIKNFFF